MYAVVNIKGQQIKVEEGQEIFVNRIDAEEGANLSFEEVLLTDQDGNVKVGNPHVANASVKATVVGHQRGDKVIVFKKKRRKGYKVKNGHRQHFTRIKIDQING